MKFFTIAGPVNPTDHYFIPHRLNEVEISRFISEKKYFILHAPRQSGKTTAILQLVTQLNQDGKYKALYVNVEPAQMARGKYKDALAIIVNRFKEAIEEHFGKEEVAAFFETRKLLASEMRGDELQTFLSWWSQNSKQPLVIFIDEIDSLVGDSLISVLRQLRAGYTNRPNKFPSTVCLVGVRDVRDYRIWSDEEKTMVLGGSAFNIKAASLVISNFSLEQIRNLYSQHTQETGQPFDTAAADYTFEQTQGQPWLVNALAYEACFNMVTDRSKPITKEILQLARETLIKRRDTHLDVLIDRLREPRVRIIVDALINGVNESLDVSQDDIQYSCDLGIIIRREGVLTIANPIYQEVFPRELASVMQDTILQKTVWYQNNDDSLNMIKLLTAFTQFYRENIDIWIERNHYKESAPHIILMAFLQRIINGGGSIHREYGLGRKRVDLLIVWPNLQPKQRIVIELKLLRNEKTLPDGLRQTAQYMDIGNATEGHLVIFDRSSTKSWDEKVFQQQEVCAGKNIHVWGM